MASSLLDCVRQYRLMTEGNPARRCRCDECKDAGSILEELEMVPAGYRKQRAAVHIA